MEIDVPTAPVSPQLLIMRMKNLVEVALQLVFHFRVFGFCCFFLVLLVAVFRSYCQLCWLKHSCKYLVTNLLNCGPSK